MAPSNRFDPFRELDRLLGEGLRTVSGSTTLPMDLYKDGDRFVGLIELVQLVRKRQKPLIVIALECHRIRLRVRIVVYRLQWDALGGHVGTQAIEVNLPRVVEALDAAFAW